MKSSLLFLSIFPLLVAAQQLYDVVIHELMADPSPSVTLPPVEWIELKNNSNVPLNLEGWRLATSTALSGAFPSHVLPPGALAIVCAAGSISQLNPYGVVIGISNFPALDNEGSTLTLLHGTRVVHCLKYTRDWYRNPLKQDGGWSLEMINALFPCSNGGNWIASSSSSGGTPGRDNQQPLVYSDESPPLLSNITSESDSVLLLHFNEPLDTSFISRLTQYQLNGITIRKAEIISPAFDLIRLVAASMSPGILHSITISDLRDCAGNIMPPVTARAGLPQTAAPGEVVLNEILFNPRDDGHDFIELYNLSEKILNLSHLYLARRATDGTLSTPSRLLPVDKYLFPGDYLAVTGSKTVVLHQYPASTSGWIENTSALPSMPDDEATIVLLNEAGMIIDELSYSERWHFSLISDPEGVSLEKISPDMPSNDPTSWHSAASSVGYATPGYRNSQYPANSAGSDLINLDSQIFSPDNDGHEDNCIISYQLPDPGWVANVMIYDLRGAIVKTLINNQLAGIKGKWIWDGLNEDDVACSPGHYIILCELFTASGKKARKKMLTVLARKL